MYKRFNARGVSYTVNREYDSKLMVGASIDLSQESVRSDDMNALAKRLISSFGFLGYHGCRWYGRCYRTSLNASMLCLC